VAEAVAQWDGLNSKKQLSPPRERAGMTRTSKEWAQPPQAAAIAALSLLEIVKIGEARSKPLPEGNRPISGVRVLSLTRVLAGPTCARTLAEYGADVLKITARHLPNLGYQEWDTGQGKLSAELDLRESANVEKLLGLVREADVFSQGYRPGTLAARGLAPERLAEMRPWHRVRLTQRFRPRRPMGLQTQF
jgi:CoA-transferase family III